MLFVRAGEWSAALLRAWARQRFSPACRRFHRQPEQRCLETLLLSPELRGLLPPRSHRRLAVSPMGIFNSPWGRHARHVWGDPNVSVRRQPILSAELRRQGVADEAQLAALVERASSRAAAPWADVCGADKEAASRAAAAASRRRRSVLGAHSLLRSGRSAS